QFFFGSQFDLAEMNRSSESMAPFPVGFQATIAVSGGGTSFNVGGGLQQCAGSTTAPSPPPYTPGWHHVTAVIDPTSTLVSLDVALVATGQTPNCSLSQSYFALGTGEVFSGSGPAIAIVELALTPIS